MRRFVLIFVLLALMVVGAFTLCCIDQADLLWIVWAFADALGPERQVVVPERPPSVPKTAVWAGGVDGGAWIECRLVRDKNADWCTVWNDQTGDVWARTLFVDRTTGDPVPDSELHYSSFDGIFIELSDGRVLEPQVFHGRVRDPWTSTPIDPPRSAVR